MSAKTKAEKVEKVEALRVEIALDEEEAERLERGGYPKQAKAWRDAAADKRAAIAKIEREG